MKLLKKFVSFNLIIIFIIFSCTNFNEIDNNNMSEEFIPPPEMEFFGFRRESYNTNFKQMELFATNAKFYEKRKMIELYDMQTYTYESNKKVAARVSGDFVNVNQDSLFIDIFTNVVAKSSNNTTLYSKHIQWDNQNKLFMSPGPVKVEQEDGSWLTGSSMIGDMSMENIIIYNEVDEGNAIGVPIEEEQ